MRDGLRSPKALFFILLCIVVFFTLGFLARRRSVRFGDIQQKKSRLSVFQEDVSENFNRANLRFSRGLARIYVHNSNDMISKVLLTKSHWEPGLVNAMEGVFNRDPRMNLIDIGCNIGVYSLVAAMRKRKVVAVDANIENIKRLRKSLVETEVADNVTLLYNAISDRYETFSISSPQKWNIGHSYLKKLSENEPHPVKSIYLDDILEVVNFKRALMKIDIEGHEYEAFHKADKLFTQIDIPFVMMEWDWIGKNKDMNIPLSVIRFFHKFNYTAYPTIASTVQLDTLLFNRWPWDIVWKKR